MRSFRGRLNGPIVTPDFFELKRRHPTGSNPEAIKSHISGEIDGDWITMPASFECRKPSTIVPRRG
jgi:hypothetical protein